MRTDFVTYIKTLLDQLGGTIELQEARGTAFEIVFPASDKPEING